MDTVQIQCGVMETEQESSFQNATLQRAGDKIAFSIATEYSVPSELISQGEAVVANHLALVLKSITARIPGMSFRVQIGPVDNEDSEGVELPRVTYSTQQWIDMLEKECGASVYASNANPGHFGFTGCDADCYTSVDAAVEAAKGYYGLND